MVELGAVRDVVLGSSPTAVSMELAPQAAEASTAYLTVEEIEMEHHPGVIYAIYLDRQDDDHRAGFLSFFGVGESETSPVREFEVTPILRRLLPGDRLTITFVPTGLEPPEGQEAEPGDATAEAADAGVRLGLVRLVAP
jgi:hypothetical protein